MLRDLQPRTRLAHRTCLPSDQAFQASRIRDAFIASEVEQGVCRTLISLFPQSLTTEPLKPGEGRVQELEKGESYSYKHAGFSSSVAHALVAIVQHRTRLLERWGLTCLKLGRMKRKERGFEIAKNNKFWRRTLPRCTSRNGTARDISLGSHHAVAQRLNEQ